MKRGKSKTDAPKKADTKLSVKKGPERAAKKPRKSKAGKDPNTPKRPQSAFFVFMEEFRKTFKEKNPNNKSVAAVAKAGGDKWKSLTEEEKAPYVAKAAKLKADYTKIMAAYNKGQSGGGGGGSRAAAAEEEEEEDGEESDKSKSEVNDDEEDDEEEEDEEDDE
ncbi:DNA-binding protein MNB1B-like [Curcuma longa]|uniref:DNA-binding protein MNB1B-like n=1 Tax=Curcuma longa TaxID=136217 RepID=UPI003D9F02A8